MWNAWTAPPGARPSDDDPWACDAHCARCGELAQDCHCDEDDMSEQQTSLGRALRRIAQGTRLTSLDAPIIDEAADKLDALAAQSGWQPIESAPKKHKHVVMLYGEEFGRRVWMLGYYFKGVPGDGEGWITTIIYCEPSDDWRGSGPQPMCWMPLPAAPGEEHTP